MDERSVSVFERIEKTYQVYLARYQQFGLREKVITLVVLVCVFLGVVVYPVYLLVSGGENDDLKAFVKGLRYQKLGKIEDVRQFEPVQAISYHERASRNPFTSVEEEKLKKMKGSKNVHTYALTLYPVSLMRLVGIVDVGAKKWVMVELPDGYTYQATVGTRIGEGNQEVVAIKKTEAIFAEKTASGWDRSKEYRLRFMPMSEIEQEAKGQKKQTRL